MSTFNNQGRPVTAVSFLNVVTAIVVFVMLGFEAWVHVDPQTSATGVYPYFHAPYPIFVFTADGAQQFKAFIENGWLNAAEWGGDKTWAKYVLLQTWHLKALYSSLVVFADMVLSWFTFARPKKPTEDD